MDYEVMKKKLDAYRKPSGQFRRVNGDLLIELLRMWEVHTGPSVDFARNLGMKSKQLGRLVQAARKIATTTEAVDPAFHELQPQESTEVGMGTGIEVIWGADSKIIRFASMDTLMDFLKRAS
jgi:hypothetical protein